MAIRERGLTGQLERKLESADLQLERYRKRSEALQKQVRPFVIFIERPSFTNNLSIGV